MRPRSELKTPHDQALFEKHHKHLLMITDASGNGAWIGQDGKTYGEWHAISSRSALMMAGCLVSQLMADSRGQIMPYLVPSWMYSAEKDRQAREILEKKR